MLRITLDETGDLLTIRLEGRIAGPWVDELRRSWADVATRTGTKLLALDLCSVTYADQGGKQVLRNICSQSGATLIADTPWTHFLAEEISGNHPDRFEEDGETC